MTRREKLLKRMRDNPRSVSMGDLQTLLESFGFELDRVKGSHHVFVGKVEGAGVTIVIPLRKPHVKAGYVKEVLALIDRIGLQEEDKDHGREDA
jgi:predicted RNA binding protein YcfA (HicA-like mRNA interferase family)